MTEPDEIRQKTAKTDDVLFAQPPAGSESPGYQNPPEGLASREEREDTGPATASPTPTDASHRRSDPGVGTVRLPADRRRRSSR